MAFFRPIELDDHNRGNKLTNGGSGLLSRNPPFSFVSFPYSFSYQLMVSLLESGRQELGENAIWSVSSAKSGSGVRYLRCVRLCRVVFARSPFLVEIMIWKHFGRATGISLISLTFNSIARRQSRLLIYSSVFAAALTTLG
jgi:hypothetical protein